MGSTKPTTMSHVHFADQTMAGVPGLLTDLQHLLDTKETADALLVIGKEGVTYHAHKLILWARCQSFRHVGSEFWSATPMKRLTIKYANLDAELFKEVLAYIYTGKIILHDLSVYGVMGIAQQLGIVDLQRACEQHICGTLSVRNACAFYSAALQTEQEQHDRDYNETGPRFSETCVEFIEENAEQVVKTEGWLELPKEAVIRLLQSDSFAMEEEEVWRAILNWAKYHAGLPLDRKPSTWNEHEKRLACQALSGVINHVKLLLIDSKVFAEEVEPTGALPMELSLERYRYAAVPDKFDTSNWRLRPRVSHKLFQGTRILTGDKLQFQRQLNTWFGESKQVWRLLYQASRDGASAEKFHHHCDGFSPTYVVILGTTGNICGGYSDVAWTSNTPSMGRYVVSNKAFLFTLVNNQAVAPTKFDVTIPQYATLHHANYGPMFGAGADLCIASNCQSGMECYSNMPHSYDGPNASSSILMGDYNFNVLDYEVYTPVHSAKS